VQNDGALQLSAGLAIDILKEDLWWLALQAESGRAGQMAPGADGS
jgi:hypothetical protein